MYRERERERFFKALGKPPLRPAAAEALADNGI